MTRVDHLVYGTPDLARGVAGIAQLLGVTPTPGGQHPGRGTRNALVSLGVGTYLEIVGPDPEQPAPVGGRMFGVDALAQPRLVTWCASASDLDGLQAEAHRHGVSLGAVASGGRRGSDGQTLSWRFTEPSALVEGGVVPFFIDWGPSPHPSATAAPGAVLIGLRATHPDPARAERMLRALHLDLAVTSGARAELIATIDSPRGRVELR